ncbi:MAG: LacI family DNA-binding transcriptional regulator [Phycisphaeraceae bacterium]
MADRQVTLRHIAEQADVSVAAVSYALHGKGRMSPARRSQLEQMLKEAGYKPSYKLRPVLYVSSHSVFHDMHTLQPLLSKYGGINDCFHAEEIPLRMELLHMPGSPSLADQLEQLLSFRPSGVLLDSDLRDEMAEVVQFFDAAGVPAVQVGHIPHVPATDSVVVDNFGGAHAGTQHLISQGHKRIATIRWNIENDLASRQKYAGFCCAMEEAGLEASEAYTVEAPLGRRAAGQPGRVAVERLLSLSQPPTAVFVENSFVSPSLLYPIPPEEAVPAEIAQLDMVHFEAWSLDWIEQVVVSKLSLPPRHTKLLRIDWYRMGQMAGEWMLAKLGGNDQTGQVTRLSPRLVHVDDGTETPLNAS